MYYYYAYINSEGICDSVSQLAGIIDDENMIEIDSYDTSLLGKKYVDGVWHEVELPETEPTETQKSIEDRLDELEAISLTTLDLIVSMKEKEEKEVDLNG